MKDNRSFFERLTGGMKMDEDPELEETQEDTPKTTVGAIEADPEEGELTVDVYQTPTEVVIKSMVAGVKPEDLDVAITRDMVTLKGKRETDRFVKPEDYVFQELYWGSFSRTIMLPSEVQVDEAEAIEKNGLLVIRLPKIDKNRQTKLRVKG